MSEVRVIEIKKREGLLLDKLDLAILENVGNLVCPAEFDTGSCSNAMILSVPEGDDKGAKNLRAVRQARR